MLSLPWVYLVTVAALLLGAGVLHVIGAVARRLGDALCRAPRVDAVLFYFTAAPWIFGTVVAGPLGVAASVGGQVSAVLLWVFLHELTHPGARRGPRIHRTLSANVGRWRNHLGLWWTAWAVPVLWPIRFAQWFVYPVLTWTVRFPRLRQRDWVNLSRQKFEGLVGYDLIWCLYCDWMTGVWSLASEMLRNVESFWCPIRFHDGRKCENCRVDFPDLEGGWVPSDATMEEVVAVLEQKYPRGAAVNPWFGSPARLTVEGAPPK